jgi:Icc-related predicted phosphoesterase
MVIAALSDLHGWLPPTLPQCDVVVIAGDVSPVRGVPHTVKAQTEWAVTEFYRWLEKIPVPVVMTWGNHDWFAEPKKRIASIPWPAHVHEVLNSGVTIDGVTFYGVPQTPRFNNWAFNHDDTLDDLGAFWRAVDDGTDVLVSHRPPRGCLDENEDGFRCGSKTLASWLDSGAANVPRVVVCGHIHEQGGRKPRPCGLSMVYNVSIRDERYHVKRGATLIEVAPR